jgi:hypothetical protein
MTSALPYKNKTPSGPYKEFRTAIGSLERLLELRRRCRQEELPASSAAALAGAGRHWPGRGDAGRGEGVLLWSGSGWSGAALVGRGTGRGGTGLARGGVARGWRRWSGAGQGEATRPSSIL